MAVYLIIRSCLCQTAWLFQLTVMLAIDDIAGWKYVSAGLALGLDDIHELHHLLLVQVLKLCLVCGDKEVTYFLFSFGSALQSAEILLSFFYFALLMVSLRLHKTPNRFSLLLDLRTELGPQRLHSLLVTRLLSLSFALE